MYIAYAKDAFICNNPVALNDVVNFLHENDDIFGTIQSGKDFMVIPIVNAKRFIRKFKEDETFSKILFSDSSNAQ